MISESYFWKKELYKNYQVLARFLHLKSYTERSFVNAEKAVMMSAYIIRKLNEAGKIPPDFLKDSICLKEYSAAVDVIDKLNLHHIDRNYNLTQCKKHNDKREFLIDQIIHSFVFYFVLDKQSNDFAFFINSDKTKKTSLFEISFEKFFEIILLVSEGIICESHYSVDKKAHERKLTFAKYCYPKSFNIKKIIKDTFSGKIYTRRKNIEYDFPTMRKEQIDKMINENITIL